MTAVFIKWNAFKKQVRMLRDCPFVRLYTIPSVRFPALQRRILWNICKIYSIIVIVYKNGMTLYLLPYICLT